MIMYYILEYISISVLITVEDEWTLQEQTVCETQNISRREIRRYQKSSDLLSS